MKSYKLDLATKTLTITKAFEDSVNSGSGDEYELYMKLLHDIQGLRVVRKTHKTPRKYNNASGEITKCNQFKNLTYDRIESFIRILPNSDAFMSVYNYLRHGAGFVQTNAYSAVRRWFIAQFPKYRVDPLFYFHNEVKPVTDLTPFIQKGSEKDMAA